MTFVKVKKLGNDGREEKEILLQLESIIYINKTAYGYRELYEIWISHNSSFRIDTDDAQKIFEKIGIS